MAGADVLLPLALEANGAVLSSLCRTKVSKSKQDLNEGNAALPTWKKPKQIASGNV
jgi:hypothetical protein